jgi:hypothetical protein
MQAQRAASAQTRGEGGFEEHQATLALLNAEFGAYRPPRACPSSTHRPA